MSAQFMNDRANDMFFQIRHSRRMIGGVCAHFADRCSLPVGLVRVVALFLVVLHPPLIATLYICAAIWLRGRDCGQAAEVPPAWDRDGLTGRFSRLDRRLAEMERAALDREMELRRAFRDLH
jgi:phage shock protein PspC (stress-responsive transcriptional regulator)